MSTRTPGEGEIVGDVLLFAGHQYYPDGGILDFKMRGSVEECKTFFLEKAREIAGEGGGYIDNWGQLVDPETLQLLEVGEVESIHGDITSPGIPVWREPEA